MRGGRRVQVEDVNPRRNTIAVRIGMQKRMCAVAAGNRIGPPEMRLPTVPDGLGNGERRSDGTRVQADLKLEHHLIKGALEYVRDVGTLDPVREPSLVLLQYLREITLVESKRILEVLDRCGSRTTR